MDNLKSTLRAGDQIIATEIAYFEYDEEVKQQLYSQQPGDIVMVNSTGYYGMVGGTGLTGVAHTGRKRLGLMGSLRDGTYRLATPKDPGYMGTKETWHEALNLEVQELNMKIIQLKAICASTIGMVLWVASTLV